MDVEDIHVDVEKSPENPGNELSKSVLPPAPPTPVISQPLPTPDSPCTTGISTLPNPITTTSIHQPKSPGHQSRSPGHQARHPGHQSRSPGHQSRSPGHQSRSPGHQARSPGHQSRSPGHQARSPAHQSKSPGHQARSPGHQSKSPGHQARSPGHQARSPAHQDRSPGAAVSATGGGGGISTSKTASPKSPSTITVLTPTKQHQKVFHTGTKRPVVVLRDIHGRQPVKRKRSPRRDSPKRALRVRRVSLPMQHHPGFEPCVLAKAKVWLPIDVIEEPFIFNEVVSLETWDKVLSEEDRERLTGLLPTFPDPDNDAKEKRDSLKKLFAGENFQFGNQADLLHKKIQSGRLHPDVIKADQLCQRQKYKEYKYRQQKRAHKLLKDVLISRQELLEAAQYTAPHEQIKVKKPRPKPAHREFDERVAKKYRRVLKEVRQDCGELDTSDEDEQYDGPEPAVTTKTWLDILAEMYPTTSTASSVQATTAPKPTPQELGLSGSPILTPPAVQSSETPYKLTEADFISLLEKHQRRRNEEEDHFDLDTNSVHLHDVVGRVYSLHRSPLPGTSPTFAAPNPPPVHKKKRKDKEKIKKKKRPKPAKTAKAPTPPPAPRVKTEPKAPLVEKPPSEMKLINQDAPSIKVEMATPKPPQKVSQITRPTPTPVRTSGFLVLIREIMTSAPNQSMSLNDLENRVTGWQRSPASLLCGWVTLEPNWTKVVGHVLRFLSGAVPSAIPVEPRVQFDMNTQMWQWIGQGKDSNEELVHLFKQWLSVMAEESTQPTNPEPVEGRRAEPVNIPSPRMNTEYVVRPSTEEEKRAFRVQEQRRYEQPHKAFTYYAHGYESVVGPVKGVFGKESSLTKAREHSLLVSERPPYVTILSLVRDAVARLPNGEGTRSEVCELLKDSQFLSLSMDTHLNTVVSGALDRLHYEKDPCVKYDTTRKMWIYLHRNRTEEEFERLHKEFAFAAKAKKSTPRQQRPVSKVKSLQKEPSLSPGTQSASALSDTSNDSIPGRHLETPSPTQSPVNTGVNPRMMVPSSMGTVIHAAGQATSPHIALTNPRAGVAGSKQTVQQHILNARLLGSSLPTPGIQVTAVRTPTTEVQASTAHHLLGENKVDGTSLIKAQLLAPRFGQLPVGTQINPYVTQPQVMLTTGATRGTQMTPTEIRNQLLAQSLARSLSMPAGVPLTRPPMTSLPTSVPHQVQAQQIAFSLAGARGTTPAARPPTAADLLKQELGLQALQAARTTTGATAVNVTLTLKRAQSMDASQYGSLQRPASNPPSIRMPTVGSLLAGLGMPHTNAPHQTGRSPTKKAKSRSKKSSSQALAGLALAHTTAGIRSPATLHQGTTQQMPTATATAAASTPATSFGFLSKEGQQSRGQVVTIQALTGPQMATSSPASTASTASLLAGATLTQPGTAGVQQAATMTLTPTTKGLSFTRAHVGGPVRSAAPPRYTTAQSVTGVGSMAPARATNQVRPPPAVRKPTQSKSQKISKMISQPGRIPEVRYSIPTAGRKTPPAASHAAAIHRLALQSLTHPATQGSPKSATQGAQKTRPQSPKTGGIHVLGSLSKVEEGKPGVTTIPMSLLLQGQGMASSAAGLPKGALPLLSSQLLGNIPVGVAQGKGLIFQMPPGSKIVTAVPVTAGGSKSPALSLATTTVSNPGTKSPVQATASMMTTSRQKYPGQSGAASGTSTPSTQVRFPHQVTKTVTQGSYVKPASQSLSVMSGEKSKLSFQVKQEPKTTTASAKTTNA